MTDHLDEAATKAVELAHDRAIPVEQRVLLMAKHLTYLAGLIRGGAVRRIEAVTPEGRANARLTSALAQARGQRDELLAAAKQAAEVAEDLTPGLVLDNLRSVIESIEADR
jgi:hypothetical protein